MNSAINYDLILYPLGHLGLVPVTFLVTFPLIQVIVFFAAATGVGLIVVGVACAEAVELGLGVGVCVATG